MTINIICKESSGRQWSALSGVSSSLCSLWLSPLSCGPCTSGNGVSVWDATVNSAAEIRRADGQMFLKQTFKKRRAAQALKTNVKGWEKSFASFARASVGESLRLRLRFQSCRGDSFICGSLPCFNCLRRESPSYYSYLYCSHVTVSVAHVTRNAEAGIRGRPRPTKASSAFPPAFSCKTWSVFSAHSVP